ncbi:hypothetical protein RHS01_05178 [Rhizoctonia solani]|uniref:Uncharacterized protein n=1 Tax=Rhizoctonia solani TaxID=456999 RepID=A0A8H7IH87_9AGAM|nr:hypothetical protein RHS01_05178 [Rhizoctonia solani]
MEPEPSLTALLEAVTALTATVGSLQAKSNLKASSSLSLKPYARRPPTYLATRIKENPKSKPSLRPSAGPVTPLHIQGRSAHSGTVRPGLKAPSAIKRNGL